MLFRSGGPRVGALRFQASVCEPYVPLLRETFKDWKEPILSPPRIRLGSCPQLPPPLTQFLADRSRLCALVEGAPAGSEVVAGTARGLREA